MTETKKHGRPLVIDTPLPSLLGVAGMAENPDYPISALQAELAALRQRSG